MGLRPMTIPPGWTDRRCGRPIRRLLNREIRKRREEEIPRIATRRSDPASVPCPSVPRKACWVGFLTSGVPAIADKINLKPNWSVISTLVLGWPAFKQDGMVPREYRPVMWLRDSSEAVEIEE